MRSIFSRSIISPGSTRAEAVRPRLNSVKKTLAATVFFTLAASAWAGFNVWTNQYSLPVSDLQVLMQPRFPMSFEQSGLLSVNASDPHLGTDPQNNQLTLKASIVISGPILAQPVSGLATIASGVKYDPADRSLKLDQPRVIDLDSSSLPAGQRQMAIGLMSSTIGAALNNRTVYQFTPEQLTVQGMHVEPGKITVGKDDVTVDIKTPVGH